MSYFSHPSDEYYEYYPTSRRCDYGPASHPTHNSGGSYDNRRPRNDRYSYFSDESRYDYVPSAPRRARYVNGYDDYYDYGDYAPLGPRGHSLTEEEERELERRPTLGDTMYAVFRFFRRML